MRMPVGRAAFAVAVALALPAAPARAEVPPNADWSEAYIETPGQPRLHADVLRPKGTPASTRLPVVLSIGPYFPHAGEQGPRNPTNDGPSLRWRDLIEQGHLFEHGYALVQVDLRGYGGSDGCNDLGGAGEQADVKRAVEWAASQPWSSGRVAVYGKSYDAWTGIMALAGKPSGLAAVVVMAPIVDGYRAVYQDGVHYDAQWWGMGAIYDAYEATPPTPFDSPDYIRAGATSTDPACYARNATQPQIDGDAGSAYWRERALPGARGSDVPVLWSHGLMDMAAKPDNILPVWSTLRGPKRAWFGQYQHDRPNEAAKSGRDGWFDELFRFLDRYVKGDPRARPDLDPPVEVADGSGRWRAEARWPPADAVPRAMALHAGTYADVPANFAEHDPAGGPFTGRGLWSFSPPMPHEAWLSGAPRATVEASAGASPAVTIALLYDVAADGRATLITRGAASVAAGAGRRRVAFDLYPQDWRLATGHRIGLLLTGSDQDWYLPRHSGAAVVVAGGALDVPFLRYRRDSYLAGRITPAIQARQPIRVDAETVRAGTVEAEIPPALVDRPAGRSRAVPRALPAAAVPSTGPQVSSTGTAATRSALAARQLVDARGRPLDGTGVSIAIIDTGIDPTHPSFRLPDGSTKVVRSLTTFCTGGGECPEDVSDPARTNSDVVPPGGHGTHVAGIAVGDELKLADGTPVGGAAPGARLVMISASAALVKIEDAFTWVLHHHAAPCGPRVPAAVCPPIRVLSNSWGADSPAISRLQEQLAAAGVVTVWANGNQGGDGSADRSNPAGEDPVPGILSAASYDDLGTGSRDGRVAATSSRGQAGAPETWPDISAPGDHIVSSCRPYLWICTVVGEQPRNGPGPYDIGTFETMSGTSMAAPAIAGIVAQLSQADPTATPARIEDALKSTAHKYSDGAAYAPAGRYTSSYDKGTGLADAFAAALKLGATRRGWCGHARCLTG